MDNYLIPIITALVGILTFTIKKMYNTVNNHLQHTLNSMDKKLDKIIELLIKIEDRTRNN